MEYYVVRIYRREPGRVVNGDLRPVRITGLVEDCDGHKESFHDAEALWRLLAQERPAEEPRGPESKDRTIG
jgi:hypothetical protein